MANRRDAEGVEAEWEKRKLSALCASGVNAPSNVLIRRITLRQLNWKSDRKVPKDFPSQRRLQTRSVRPQSAKHLRMPPFNTGIDVRLVECDDIKVSGRTPQSRSRASGGRHEYPVDRGNPRPLRREGAENPEAVEL